MRLSPISYRPVAHAHGRKNNNNYRRRTPPQASRLPDNWREKALVDTHRRVREREDPEYDTVVGSVNKLSREFFQDMVKATLEVLAKRDEMFRLRVATLIFDRGIQQNFFAPLIAEFIQALVKEIPELRDDIEAQIQMFDTLYDASNVVMVPSSNAAGYDEAIIAWMKQKEKKRGYAVLVGELFTRSLVPPATMEAMIRVVLEDMEKSSVLAKSEATTEHVDHLIRFLFAIAPHVKGRFIPEIQAILSRPRTDLPSFTMKSRFKLEDALKILQSSST